MNKILYFIIVGICIGITSCKEDKSNLYLNQFGIKYNQTRSKFHIPNLDTSSKTFVQFVEGDSTYFITYSSKKTSNSFCVLSKVVAIKNDSIIRDENSFLGKRRYETVDGTFVETLYISAYWDTERVIHWDCEYADPDLRQRRPINKNQADSIAASWNLKTY